MKNYVNELIAQIKALACTEIPAWINTQTADNFDEKKYREYRTELNTLVVQALTGSELKKTKKGDFKLHFNKALPTQAQVHEISCIMQTFADAYEKTCNDDSDVALPCTRLGIIEKCSNKKLKNAIMGPAGILDEFIDGLDCVAIAAMGADARKRRNVMLASIIVGSTVLVAGGVTCGIVFYNKKKNGSNDADGEFDEIDIAETDETPQVELDALTTVAI